LLSYLLAETAAVLAVVVVVDHERHAQSLAAQFSPTFIGILLGLIAVACTGFLASARRGGRVLGRAATKALLLAFGVIALGVGTLTWALTAP
jgi:cytochrome bd-type quinol oxidase subunit 2